MKNALLCLLLGLFTFAFTSVTPAASSLSGRNKGLVTVASTKQKATRSPNRANNRTNKAKPRQAKGLTPAEIEARDAPLTGIEEFVAKHLADKRKVKMLDVSAAPPLEDLLNQSTNYHQLPPQYVALINANRDQQSWKKNYAMLYWGKEKKMLLYGDRRIVVEYNELDSSDMMATFEPIPDAKPFFIVPDKVLKTFSDEERAYTETLRDVVNENISFLFDVPFFVPDMEMFHRNEYGGKFIPEKYLVSGDKVDLIPAHLVDDRKRDMQKRFGFPIYDVTQVETGRISSGSACFYDSEYDKMQVVDRLVLLNLDVVNNENGALMTMRIVQYDRVKKGFALMRTALANEADYLKDKGQWTPKIQKVLTQLDKQLEKIMPPAEKMMTEYRRNDKFIYSLNQPDRQPRLVRQRDVTKPAPYTSGRLRENTVPQTK
jgi:hypothetical protein